MVGYLMLLKLIHYKLHKKRMKKNNHVKISNVKLETEKLIIKKEVNEFVDIRTCRICLNDGDIPIYGNSVMEDISQDLRLYANIEVNKDDSYPKFICQACHSLLQGAILFRKKAQESDRILHQPLENFSDNDSFTKTDDPGFEVDDKSKSEYCCKKCDMTFQSFQEYSEHRLSEEHENMRQTCPICKKSYATLYYRRHLSLHKVKTPFICDICGKRFVIQGQFTRHRKTHFSHLPFKCDQCPYRGRFKESLKMHMRSHTGERPYQCTQCPSRFVNKSNLNKHMLTHKGDHDFKCESCGRGFYTERDLNLHFKVVHSGLKEHICDVCGKAFGYRKQMMKHQLKVHKREKFKSGRMPLYLQYEATKS